MESPPPTVGTSNTPPVKVTQAKPKRAPKKGSGKGPTPVDTAAAAATPPPAPAPAPPPVDTAAAATPSASPIGELSTGDDANPQKQQDALDLITSSERRLQELSKTATQQQRTQLRKVSYFLRQARQALGTGDVEGAKTLATKAKVLLDDLSK
jgi:hypothetical protein